MIQALHGDCRDVLKTLAAGSVQCVVTSPPYFGLRDYGVAGQIGLEATPAGFVTEMVAVFAEVRRVLRDDGTCWLNLGDAYESGTRTTRDYSKTTKHGYWNNPAINQRVSGGMKTKDLLMIPARVALALQADGWFLRSDIIWAKPNPMPESVTDRPTSSYEHVFLLTKRARYFYDAGAIAEPFTGHPIGPGGSFAGTSGVKVFTDRNDGGRAVGRSAEASGRNARNVWTIATQPYPEAHFATFPPELAERCIKAGSRPGDTILDPFAGAFTTALAADRLRRDAIGIELNPAYCAMGRSRIERDAGMFADVQASVA